MPFNPATFDLTLVPNAETDEYEFKSSVTPIDSLKEKLSRAVSGFANSGGGLFIAGVDGNGNADGGIPSQIGREPLRDWADRIIHGVEPTPNYDVCIISNVSGRGSLKGSNVVLAVHVPESFSGPHMAADRKYYVRAGVHTDPARHFVVEALWAKRHSAKPRLTHLFRTKPGVFTTLQLGIVALTDAPALDVIINLSPLPGLLSGSTAFPLRIPVIDRLNPFFFDVGFAVGPNQDFDRDVTLRVDYRGIDGNVYVLDELLRLEKAVAPVDIGTDTGQQIVRALESIGQSLRR